MALGLNDASRLSRRNDWQGNGTRFLLFAQPPFVAGYSDPETVWVSPPAGTIGPGPSDDRMYAIYPPDKRITYGTRLPPSGERYSPPWTGPIYPPAMPDAEGHFDHVEVGTPQFEAAHLYGSARFVLDVWEGYFGQPINWHFGDLYERMELIIMPRFNNATMGYGFMEVGGFIREGEYRPFSLNFDVIGHEVGHSIIYPIVGVPDPDRVKSDYYGFHESAADMVGLVASLHFGSVIDQLLGNTRGNLYAFNEFNRFGEITANDQIRIASNTASLFEFEAGWHDEHDLGQPLTGAVFDTFVDFFHEILKERGLLTEAAEDLSDELEESENYDEVLQKVFDKAYAANPAGFREAFVDARDLIGRMLVETFVMLTPMLTFKDVGEALLAAEQSVIGGRWREIVLFNLWRRGIGRVEAGPRLSPPDDDSHAHSVRTEVPGPSHRCNRRRRMTYSRRYLMSRNERSRFIYR